jgi:hypothetical protein
VLKIIEDIEESFKSLRGEAGTILKNKFKTVFENNNGLSTLKRISKILSGEEENSELDGDPEELIIHKKNINNPTQSYRWL